MEKEKDELQQLLDEIAQKNTLQSRRDKLRFHRRILEEREYALRREKEEEQADVERLQGRSLAVWFYTVFGQKEKKLTKEEREACEAAVRHDAVLKELESVDRDLAEIDRGLREVMGCEQRYAAAKEQRQDRLRQADTPEGLRFLELEKQLLACKSMKKELQEAIRAGKQADSAANAVLQELNSAEGWGTYDVVGGGIFADIAKHDHLDRAQSGVEALQNALHRFKTELADVSVQAQLNVSVDGYLRFADLFFDGLFSALSVLDHIKSSKNQVEGVRRDIWQVLRRLENMLDETVRTENKVSGEMHTLVLNVKEL